MHGIFNLNVLNHMSGDNSNTISVKHVISNLKKMNMLIGLFNIDKAYYDIELAGLTSVKRYKVYRYI